MRALITRSIACLVVAACGDDGGTTTEPDAQSMGEDIAIVPADCVPDRATTDRPDDHEFDQIHVMYVVPSDGTDAQLDTNGKICNSVRAFASWFNTASGSHLRFDTYGGLLDITFVRLPKTDVEMRGNDPSNATVEQGTGYVLNRIEREMTTLGMHDGNKLYAYYYDGTSTWACGGGAYPPLIPGRAGAMYLRGLPTGQSMLCGQSFPWGQDSLVPNYIDYGMMHELVHSLGMAPMVAPHQHSYGHVFDPTASAPNRDLMYSPRMGQQDPGWGTNGPQPLELDLGRDDYFQANLGIELAKSSLLSPLPEGARRPPGW